MYFKNLQPYRLSPEWPITLDALRPSVGAETTEEAAS